MEEVRFSGADGTELFGRIWSSKAPRAALLLIHGHGEHGGRYTQMAEYLVKMDMAVFAFDYRGHGLSGGKRGLVLRWNELHEDTHSAVSLLADRFPTIPMFLYGHSLGGTIALEYAVSGGIVPRGLIISAPALGTPGISPVILTLGRFLSTVAPRIIMSTGLDSDNISRIPEECRKYREDPLVHDKAAVRMSTELTKAQEQIFAGAGGLLCPILLCYGGEDHIAPRTPIEEFFELVGHEDKALHIFPDAYHEVHNDLIRDEVNRLYGNWIQSRI
jgi:alpha-beta hydrolase superfamily lysophospholipase